VGIAGNNRGMKEKRLKRTTWQFKQRKSFVAEETVVAGLVSV
jgi:hypothetical protein